MVRQRRGRGEEKERKRERSNCEIDPRLFLFLMNMKGVDDFGEAGGCGEVESVVRGPSLGRGTRKKEMELKGKMDYPDERRKRKRRFFPVFYFSFPCRKKNRSSHLTIYCKCTSGFQYFFPDAYIVVHSAAPDAYIVCLFVCLLSFTCYPATCGPKGHGSGGG